LIFLPNKFEKYTAGLRNIFQKLIIKNGIKKNYLVNLGKIYENEAIFSASFLIPTDAEKFFLSILKPIYIKKFLQKRTPQFFCNLSGNLILNRKLVAVLIFRILQKSDFIKICEERGKILIYSKVEYDLDISKIIKKLDGVFLKEVKEKRQLIILSFDKTEKKQKDSEEEFFSLQNPLSPVNYYL